MHTTLGKQDVRSQSPGEELRVACKKGLHDPGPGKLTRAHSHTLNLLGSGN